VRLLDPLRYDTRPVASSWRHLRLGSFKLVVRAELRRLVCPAHGVRVEGVAFARPGSRFTRDFEQLVAWLAVKMDKDALRRLVQVDWDTVGRICDRVVADELDPGRLDELYDIGVDEISWKKHHNYLTLVVNHTTNKVVWGAEGRDAKTLDGFFDELGEARSRQIRAVSMDMGPAFRKSVTAAGHAPQATICIDPFHAVKNVTDALNVVRRDLWQQLRQLPEPDIAKKFKGARWALLKNPEDLTDSQQAAPWSRSSRHGGRCGGPTDSRKPSGPSSLATSPTTRPASCSTAGAPGRNAAGSPRSSRPPAPCANIATGILAAIRLGLTNARLEGLNQRVRLIMRRAFGFHSAGRARPGDALRRPHQPPTALGASGMNTPTSMPEEPAAIVPDRGLAVRRILKHPRQALSRTYPARSPPGPREPRRPAPWED
jgi:transposase